MVEEPGGECEGDRKYKVINNQKGIMFLGEEIIYGDDYASVTDMVIV